MGKFKEIKGLFEEEGDWGWFRPPYVDEEENPKCKHEWKKTIGLYRIYEDCIHCDVKKEDLENE